MRESSSWSDISCNHPRFLELGYGPLHHALQVPMVRQQTGLWQVSYLQLHRRPPISEGFQQAKSHD